MHLLVVLCCALCASVVTVCADEAASDVSEYLVPPAPSQEIDFAAISDMIKENKRRKKYKAEYDDDSKSEWVEGVQFTEKEINCLVEDGKCGQKFADIKKTIIKALTDSCKSCSPSEKKTAGSAVALMMFGQPEVWKRFLVKYDVNNNFMKRYL